MSSFGRISRSLPHDTQLFLGCNDTMTSEFISKRCGNVTIQLTNSMSPQTPLFSPITREVTGYRQTKSNNTRPLMYPEEVLQLDNKECLLLIRGQKPLKAYKIIPDELSAYRELEFTRISDYIPKWRREEQEEPTKPEQEVQTDAAIEPEPEAEPEIETYIKPIPNFGTNAGRDEEQPKESNIQITLDESVFDPDTYTETDAEDILNE